MAKLLLVEDDNNLREIYEARLSAEGYDITTAQNGEEALSVAKSVHPDLIISDVMMPRISGFEMLDILRNTDELKNTKIIMLTALGQAEDRGRADNLGADRYLVKSQVTLEDIVKAAEELLADEAALTPPVATAEEPAVAVPASSVAETPVSPEPVQPVVAEPVIDTAPVSVPNPAAEVTASMTPQEGVVTNSMPTTTMPIPEPVITSTPTVADPIMTEPVQVADPVASQPAVIVNDPLATPASTTVNVPDPDPIAVTPLQVEVPYVQAAEAPVAESSIPSSSQTLAAEEEAIEQQIASFAEAPEQPAEQPQVPVVAAPTTIAPSPESVANDAVLAQAMTDLTSTSAPIVAQPEITTNVEPVPAPIPAPEVTAAAPQPDATIDTIGASQQVTGHKTIEPLDSTANAGTTNLEALLAAEDAKESAAPVPQTTAPMAEPPKPEIDPNTIAL